ncbi:MAG: phytanoyl-CoA dioxygenase family protein [Candidatus Latescibacteria bacterium]|nr:phytanoyl-CoA dioxygenase family protein [Candidatus Latescibacterota bacterium]
MSISTQTPIRLTDEQLAAYHRDGFLVVEDLVSPEELDALRNRVKEYTHGGRPAGSIHVQVEPRVQRGEMTVAHPGDGIRKLTGLVEGDDLFCQLGLNENIVGIIEQIVGPDIKMFRNAMLLKPPQVGSAKGMHQDSPYWPIEPMDLCSCWFTLDDATVENGCMAALPGWHKKGPLPHVHVTDDYVVDERYYDSSEMVLCPLRAGGGLFFHSLLPHYTAPNRSNTWRRAIALSYMSSKSRHTGEGESPVYFHVKGKTYPGCVR